MDKVKWMITIIFVLAVTFLLAWGMTTDSDAKVDSDGYGFGYGYEQ